MEDTYPVKHVNNPVVRDDVRLHDHGIIEPDRSICIYSDFDLWASHARQNLSVLQVETILSTGNSVVFQCFSQIWYAKGRVR
jgi:hypothetical protein